MTCIVYHIVAFVQTPCCHPYGIKLLGERTLRNKDFGQMTIRHKTIRKIIIETKQLELYD